MREEEEGVGRRDGVMKEVEEGRRGRRAEGGRGEGEAMPHAHWSDVGPREMHSLTLLL